MIIKKYLLLLLIIITTFLSGCSGDDSPPSNENESFESICDYITDTILTDSAIDLHFCLSDTYEYDQNSTDKILGSISEDSSDENFYEECLKLIEDISIEQLSEENTYKYELINSYLKNQIDLSSYEYKYEPLSAYSGEHVQLPLLLTEFAFNDANDIDIYLELLSDFPNYFTDIAEYEQKKNEAGQFMAENTLKSVIDFCSQFPTDDPAEHFLSKSFEEKINQTNLDETAKADYVATHREILKSKVFPAYKALQSRLEEISLSANYNNQGLCHTSGGRKYYNTLIKCKTGDNRELSDIDNDLRQRLSFLSETLSTTLSGNPDILEPILGNTLNKTLDAEETLEKASEYMEILYSISETDFGNESEKNYSIEYIEPHLSTYFSSAFFLLPPVDDFDNPTIYINPDTPFTTFDLFTTLAHEGFPGHLHQTITQKDNLFARLFSCLGYCEGWATYCELYTYPDAVKQLNLGDETNAENLASILKTYRELTLCVYALLDYNIHYNYWTTEDASSFLSDYGITDESAVNNIYNYIVSEPANYMTYYVGYINVLSLKEQYIAAGHTEKEFHIEFLKCGEAPFDIVGKKLLKTQ